MSKKNGVYRKCLYSLETEFKKGQNTGSKHWLWKGKDVWYSALHSWIKRNWGKPCKCEACKNPKGRFEWANITGEYNRIRKNWMMLCRSCLIKEDLNNPKYPIL